MAVAAMATMGCACGGLTPGLATPFLQHKSRHVPKDPNILETACSHAKLTHSPSLSCDCGLASGDLVVTSKTNASPGHAADPSARNTAQRFPNPISAKPGRLGALVLRIGVGTSGPLRVQIFRFRGPKISQRLVEVWAESSALPPGVGAPGTPSRRHAAVEAGTQLTPSTSVEWGTCRTPSVGWHMLLQDALNHQTATSGTQSHIEESC